MLGFDSIASATLIAYDGVPVLTTDAWITDDAYFGSWTHDYSIPPEPMDAIKRAKFHWLSHGHPDHLSVPSLALLTDGQFLLSDHYGGPVRRDLEALGHRLSVLNDREWGQLSDRIKVYPIANQNQDSILLTDVGGTLIIDTNDSPDFGASWYVRSIAKHYKNVFYCALHGWGGANMVNLFNPEGRKLTDPRNKRRPMPRARFMTLIEREIFDDLLIGSKRVSELMSLARRKVTPRGYSPVDIPMLQLMGVASAFSSVVILSLFVQDEATTRLYASAAMLWCTVPFIVFWLCGIWLSTVRGYLHDDPIVYAAKD
jgi:hypothetical protein